MSTDSLSITIASSVASVFSTLASNPFEVIKIRQQTSGLFCKSSVHKKKVRVSNIRYLYFKISTAYPENTNWSSVRSVVRNAYQMRRRQLMPLVLDIEKCQCVHPYSLVNAFEQIKAREGWKTFFNGWKYAVVQSCISNVMYFYFYENLKNSLKQLQLPKEFITVPLFASGISRLITTSVTFPLDYWRVLQSSFKGYTTKSNFQLGYNVTAAFKITLQRDLAFSCSYWLVLENTKRELSNQFFRMDEVSPQQDLINLLSGVTGGVISAIITLPFDIAKTRIQVGTRSDLNQPIQQQKEPSVSQIFMDIIKKEGIKGIFKGFQPRVMKVTINSGLLFMIYEIIKRRFINLENKP